MADWSIPELVWKSSTIAAAPHRTQVFVTKARQLLVACASTYPASLYGWLEEEGSFSVQDRSFLIYFTFIYFLGVSSNLTFLLFESQSTLVTLPL